MTNSNAIDRLVTIKLLEEFDRIIADLRHTAREADSAATGADADAYKELAAKISELRFLASKTASTNVSDFQCEWADSVSGLSVQVVSTCDFGSLVKLLDEANKAICNWLPKPMEKPERPRLVLGSDEEVLAAWQEDRDALMQARLPERQVQQEIKTAASALVAFLDSARRSVDFPKPTDEALYSIRKKPSGAYTIHFQGNEGDIIGSGADRFVQLCRFGKLNVEQLAADTFEVSESRSVSRLDENASYQTERRVPLAVELGPKKFGTLRGAMIKELEDIDQKLAECSSNEERERLESQRTTLTRYRNSFWRTPDTEIDTMKDTVEKSLQRLVKQCRSDMPLLSEHIQSSWKYDSLQDQFEYCGVAWTFLDF